MAADTPDARATAYHLGRAIYLLNTMATGRELSHAHLAALRAAPNRVLAELSAKALSHPASGARAKSLEPMLFEAMAHLSPQPPTRLPPDELGSFWIGYHHQKSGAYHTGQP